MSEAPSPHAPDAAAASLRSAASVFAAFAAGALLLSFLVSPEGLPAVEVCSFRSLTGLPCPGCGLTRGFCAISHGRFRDAWGFNAFAWPFYGLSLALLPGPWLVRRYPALASGKARRLLFRAGGWLAATLVAYGLWRIALLW